MTIEEAKKVILANLPVMVNPILKEAVYTVFDALNENGVDLPGEVWKDIEGYEGLYQVSNKGRVKSFHFGKEKILKPYLRANGYLMLCLQVDKIKAHFIIHRLVATAFIPNPVNLPVVNHIDGNKQNNCVENLEWTTYSENEKHAYKLGLKFRNAFAGEGEDCIFSKFTNAKVQEIRKIYKPRDKKFGQAALAKKYGVHRDTIQNIVNHKTYKNVK